MMIYRKEVAQPINGVPAGSIQSSTVLSATGDTLALLSGLSAISAGGFAAYAGTAALASACAAAAALAAVGAIAFTIGSWMTDSTIDVDWWINEIQT